MHYTSMPVLIMLGFLLFFLGIVCASVYHVWKWLNRCDNCKWFNQNKPSEIFVDDSKNAIIAESVSMKQMSSASDVQVEQLNAQISKEQWDEVEAWDWANSENPAILPFVQYCSDTQIRNMTTNFYINILIPIFLNENGIMDTVQTRIAAFVCGKEKFKQIYKSKGNMWKHCISDIAKQEIRRYNEYMRNKQE